MHMEGEFLRKPSAAIARAIVALCGVIMIILFFFLRRLDPEIRENMDPFGNDYVLLIFGALAILISVLAYFFNRHAYLHLSEEHISARHNWNKRLFCKYSDIAFVEFGPMTLTLTLKNGKTHNFFTLKMPKRFAAPSANGFIAPRKTNRTLQRCATDSQWNRKNIKRNFGF